MSNMLQRTTYQHITCFLKLLQITSRSQMCAARGRSGPYTRWRLQLGNKITLTKIVKTAKGGGSCATRCSKIRSRQSFVDYRYDLRLQVVVKQNYADYKLLTRLGCLSNHPCLYRDNCSARFWNLSSCERAIAGKQDELREQQSDGNIDIRWQRLFLT